MEPLFWYGDSTGYPYVKEQVMGNGNVAFLKIGKPFFCKTQVNTRFHSPLLMMGIYQRTNQLTN